MQGETGQGPVFLGSEIYRFSSYGGQHPLRIPRVSTAMDLCRVLGWLPAGRYVQSPRAKAPALSAFHTPEYLEALIAAEAAQEVTPEVRARHRIGTPSNPVFPEMFRRPATGAGAAILAGGLLRAGGIVFAPGAGTHHGLADRASGFCYLNDCVLGILSLRHQGLRRIAYVDIDAHHGDGVELAFADDPDVLMISVHEAGRWPGTGQLQDRGLGQVFNLPVPAGLNDSEMAEITAGLIRPALEAFAPEAVVLQCGADALEEDPQSRLALSNWAHRDVLAAIRPVAPRLLVTGGGGYNPWSVGRLWALIWADLAGESVPDPLPPEARAVLTALAWPHKRGFRGPPPGWTDRLIDPPRPGPIRAELREAIGHLRARLPALPRG